MIGGAGGVSIRFSNRELPPFWAAGLRFATAALVFWLLVVAGRFTLPRGRPLVGALLYGLLTFGVSSALIYWSLLTVGAAVAQVVVATVPLLTLLLAIAHGQERFRLSRLAGSLIAIAGIALIFNERITGGTASVASLLAILAGAVLISEGLIVAKALPQVPGPTMNAIGMTVAAAFLLVISLAAHEAWRLPQRSATWVALGYLVALASVTVFWLYLFVLRRWTASATSYQYILFPIVAIVVAAWLDREAISFALLGGGLLVVAGVYVGALSRSAPDARPQIEIPARR